MAKKGIKILIPNATGPSNPGDQAILMSMITILRSSIPEVEEITIHSSDSHLYKKTPGIKVKPTLYAWAGFENKNPFVRVLRLYRLLFSYITTKVGFPIVISTDLRAFLRDYKKADLIVFAGGGYLRSQTGLTQTLNLLMNLSMFQFAKLYGKKIIVAPISIGPFGYKWHEKLTARTLREFAVVFLRENHSYSILKKHRVRNILHANDLALLEIHKSEKRRGKHPFVVGFTIRDWLPGEKQNTLEAAYFHALMAFSKKVNAVIKPIVQVDNNSYGDKDREIAKNLTKRLTEHGITTLPLKIIKNYPDDTIVYSEIDMLLGMRMHSLIFATLHNTPFVAVSYEYKTEGLVQSLGMSDLCIPSAKVNEKNLTEMLFKVYKNRVSLKNSLEKSLQKIRIEEKTRWKNVFSQ